MIGSADSPSQTNRMIQLAPTSFIALTRLSAITLSQQAQSAGKSPARIAKGLAMHPIGVILLARLAIDRTEHGAGLGRTMLVDALSRAMIASDAIGARAILVHAIDEDAVTFYRKFGFEPSPLDPKQLMLLMKDLRATLKSVGLG
jgi:GNAT superfamily N-acetyltransferase